LLRARFKPEQILSLAGDQVPLPDRSLDYVTALDVLEHVPDDAAVVRGFWRLLKPGGVALVTVPASMALWSDWDEALHHFRRYNRAQLRALFPDTQWEIVHVNYTNVVVYPAVWLVRKWRRLTRKKDVNDGGLRAEDRAPSAWLNAVLRRMFVRLGTSSVPFPFGVSLLLLARKRGS
jgi:SAM-dependent methyltransferase